MKKHETVEALVVDDNQQWRTTLVRLVEKAGFAVLIASSFDEAIRLLEDNSQQSLLFITDIRLKDDDAENVEGLEILKYLYDNDRLWRGIVVTGYPSFETRQFTEALGAVYLEKGAFSMGDFLKILRDFKKPAQAYQEQVDRPVSNHLSLHDLVNGLFQKHVEHNAI